MSGEDCNNGGFGSSSSSSSTMQFKKFVTEDEIVEKRRIRQEEWEKARKADDPLEAPEEEYDPRSLYEKLEEQKQRKQEEFESQFKFGNQVRGLDEEEAKFLDFVSDQQEKIEKCRQTEEAEAIHEYRNAVISQPATSSKSPVIKSRSAPGPSSSKKSQMTLLAGAVKRKNSTTNNEADGKKKKSTATSDEENNPVGPPDSTTEAASASLSAALPCVVTYSDSSDSDSSSSSSDIDTDLLRRAIHIDMTEEQQKAHH